MKKILILVILAAVAAAVYFTTAGSGGAKTLGKPVPSGPTPAQIAAVAKQAKNSPVVIIEGEITEKCPTAGCWFYLKDDSGSIRVDTQFAGFNILDVPTGSWVRVQGKVIKPEDGEPEISASGMTVER